MKIDNVHLIREVLVLDAKGKKKPMIQISYAKPFDLHPVFRDVPLRDRKQMQTLYEELGGGRLKEWQVGLTVIIPH